MATAGKNPGDSFANSDKRDFQYSNGDLYDPGVTVDAVNSANNGDGTHDIKIDWTYDASSNIQDGTDVLLVLVVNEETNDYRTINPSVARSAGTATVTISAPDAENWLFIPYFQNTVGTDNSAAFPVARANSTDGPVAL